MKTRATNAVEWVRDEVQSSYSQSFGNINMPEISLTELVQQRNNALAEGERRGKIAGLREAAAICSRLGLSPDARVALNDEANRLQKEQSKSIPSDTPETKTKQER